MARLKPLKYRYSTQLKTKNADYLPIIGSKVPNKLLTYFANADFISGLVSMVSNGTPQRWSQNQNKSYRADGCAKMIFTGGASQTTTTSINFSTIAGYYNTKEKTELYLDTKSINYKTNNYAKVIRAGSGVADKNDLFFVINIWNQILSGVAGVSLSFYSGTDYAYLKNDYVPKFTRANQKGTWQKCQWALNSTNFTYTGAFSDSSWENITQVKIIVGAGAQYTDLIGDVYLHGAWIALPKENSELTGAVISPTITGAYYPDTSTALKVAKWQILNGYDTLGLAINAAITGANKNIVILDSFAHRPLSGDLRTIGIKGNLNGVKIYADYLEEPVTSSKKTTINTAIIGSKINGYTKYDDSWKTTLGTVRKTVGKTGAMYTTIQSAINSSTTAKTVIDIIDSQTYQETLSITAGKNITIQAENGQAPAIQSISTGAEVLVMGTVIFNNITFSGRLIENEIMVNMLAGNGVFNNCYFKNVGGNYTASNANVFKTSATCNLTLNDCLFNSFGNCISVFNMIENNTPNLTLNNCNCYLSSQNANTYFIYANLGQKQQIYVIGCKVMTDSSNNYAYMIKNTLTAPGATAPYIFVYFNETNTRIDLGFVKSGITSPGVGGGSIYICKNYIHDITTSIPIYSHINRDCINNLSFNAIYLLTVIGEFYIQGNIFNNIKSSGDSKCYCICGDNGDIYNLYSGYSGNLWVNNNIFYNSDLGLYTHVTIQTWNNNIAVNCGVGLVITTYTQAIYIDGWIFTNCIKSIQNAQATNDRLIPQPTNICYIQNSIIFNAPIDKPVSYTTSGVLVISYGGQLLYNNTSTENPDFTNPAAFDFSWNFTSSIETVNCFNWITDNAIITNSGAGAFYFMNFEGETGEVMADTKDSINYYNFCTFKGMGIALNDRSNPAIMNNCYVSGSGIGVRTNRTTLNTPSTLTNCILTNNNMAVFARSDVSLINVTATENTYGVMGMATNFLTAQQVILTSCLLVKNSGFDYGLNFTPVSCIVSKSLFSISQTINFTSALLDPDYLYPAIKKMGYSANSPAYIASGNIGARNVNTYLTPTLSYTDYQSFYVGTVDTNEEFYALENPQMIPLNQTAINGKAVTFVNGDYSINPTAYINEYMLKWNAPGIEGKISTAFKTALLAMFQSTWFVALSTDMGTTWTYYRVIKDSAISMEQQKYLFDTLPYGSLTMKIREIPDFLITDYTP